MYQDSFNSLTHSKIGLKSESRLVNKHSLSKRVFIRGIPVRVEKSEIIEFFAQYGPIEHCKMKKNSKTKRSMGYACISFRDESVAQSLHGKAVNFQGRICECKPVLKEKELVEHLAFESKVKLFVFNLDIKWSSGELIDIFQNLAPISYAYVIKDSANSDENKGYGFVVFQSIEDADEFCRNYKNVHYDTGKIIQYKRGYKGSSVQLASQFHSEKKGSLSSQTGQDIAFEWQASKEKSNFSRPIDSDAIEAIDNHIFNNAPQGKTNFGFDLRHLSSHKVASSSAFNWEECTENKSDFKFFALNQTICNTPIQSQLISKKSIVLDGSQNKWQFTKRSTREMITSNNIGSMNESIDNYRFNQRKSPVHMETKPNKQLLSLCFRQYRNF